MKVFIAVAAALAFFALAGIVGRMDFTDEIRMQQAYCKGVEEGQFPDYKHNYEKECTDEKKSEYAQLLR